MGFLRNLGLYSKWEVLEAMDHGKWYYGSELSKSNDFPMSSIYNKLGSLKDEGYIEDRESWSEMDLLDDDGNVVARATLRRLQFKKTTKDAPEKKSFFQPTMMPQM